MTNTSINGAKDKLIKNIQEMFTREIADFCQGLNKKVSEQLSRLAGNPKEKTMDTGWLAFWYLLEHKILNRYQELELAEVDPNIFDATDYWKEGMSPQEFMEKINEALTDLEYYWDTHGENLLNTSEED